MDVPLLHAPPTPPASLPPASVSSDTEQLNGMGMLFIFGGNWNYMNDGSGGPQPVFLGVFIAIFGGLFFLFCEFVAVCLILSGRNLHKRRRRTFSFIVACVGCLWMPFGTALGIFTLIVLCRPSVQRLYTSKLASHS